MREREWELYDFHYDNVPKVDNNELSMFLLISQNSKTITHKVSYSNRVFLILLGNACTFCLLHIRRLARNFIYEYGLIRWGKHIEYIITINFCKQIYSMPWEKVLYTLTNIFCRGKVLKYRMPVRICFCFIWSISSSLRSSWSTFLLVLSLSHFKKYVDNIYLNT